jgi:hypothetical protein
VVKTLVAPPKPTIASGWQNALVVQPYVITFMEEYGSPPVVATGVTTNASGYVLAGWQRQQTAFPVITFWTSGDTAQTLTNRPQSVVVRPDQNDFISVAVFPQSNLVANVMQVTYPNRSFTVSGSVSGILSQYIDAGPAGLTALTSGQTSDGKPGYIDFAGYDVLFRYNHWVSGCIAAGASGEAGACALALFDAFFDDVEECGFRYTVSLYTIASGDTYYRAKDAQTDEWSYTVKPEGRFVDQLVYFRNSLGGVDCYNFTMKNRKTGNINRSTFGKNSDVFGSSTFDAVYFGEFSETWTLVSDWLTAEDSEWLAEMIYSPQVWLMIDGVLTEAVVNTSAYQFFQRPQDKLNQLTIEVMIAYKTEIV